MNIYLIFYIFSLLIVISYSQQIRESIPDTEKIQSDCRPDCSNAGKPECNKFEIELRAAISKCESSISPIIKTPSPDYEEDTDSTDSCTIKCGKKLRATLKVINQGETATFNQYIIIDHVIDSSNGQRVSLLNPYVVVLKQKPLLQLYGLKYKYAVNGEAKEHVVNKRNPSFLGCDDMSDNPTCGSIRYNGDIIPYSQGFCCSCDEKKNVRRQPRNTETQNSSLNIQDLIYQNGLKWHDDLEFSRFQNPFTREKRQSNFRANDVIYVTPKIVPKYRNLFSRQQDLFRIPQKKAYNDDKNFQSVEENDEDDVDYDVNELEMEGHHIQPRGGQNCDDKWMPKRANPNTYHDSAHCLRFSKLWYAVYQISDPILEHAVYLRIFEKRERGDGSTCWIDLTRGKTIEVGSFHNKFRDKTPTITVTYENPQQGGEPLPFSLDPKTKRVLIPQEVPKTEMGKHSEFQGGAPEYLVVDAKNIQSSGDQCNAAGVGYVAFYNQPARCSMPKGSCLKNQPRQLWRHDKRACKQGKRGKYFLKNYATVPEDALRRTKKGDANYLALNYGERYKSSIDIEVKADDNIIFKSVALAKITEIYVDSTSETATILTIKIHNNGLVSNVFHPRMADCPLELPVDWGTLEGDPTLIAPQHHFTFTLRLLGVLPVKNFFCTIEALNSKNEIVAARRIRIVKSDRCICSWHCLCACLETTGLGCIQMTLEHYKAAGFVGSMPLTTNMVRWSSLESALFGVCFFLLLLIIILLFLGVTKALIGHFCFVPIGIWGLEVLIGIQPLIRYHEFYLEDRHVVYDEEGWPVHPDTKKRTVRIVNERVEFCLNVVFFFTYPIMLLLLLCSKFCCPFYAYSGDEDKNHTFKGVSTVAYGKYPDTKPGSDTDSEGREDAFEFEESGASN